MPIKLTQDIVINRFIDVHGNERFDYSNFNYIDAHSKSRVKCNACSFVFDVSYNQHYTKKLGCPKCVGRRRTNDEAISLCKSAHPNVLYGFDKFVDVTLGKISYFNTDKYKVMKIEVESEGAHKLNALLRDNLEYTNKFPDYNPHVTIAYVKPDFDESQVDVNMFSGNEATIDSIVFSSKNKNIGREDITL